MRTRTIEDIKQELDSAWADLTKLDRELTALETEATIIVDLATNHEEDMLRKARQKYYLDRETYLTAKRALDDKIRVLRNKIQNLLDEAKLLLFESSGIPHQPPT